MGWLEVPTDSGMSLACQHRPLAFHEVLQMMIHVHCSEQETD